MTNMLERAKRLVKLTEDLEVANAEFAAALDENDQPRADQALSDIAQIAILMREVF